jgi:TolB-like protein/class 3 adenylate cyclase/Flp pilus assembly protein TadD
MAADKPPDSPLEICHVLFMDIVGYSKAATDEQRDLQNELNEVVRATAQFQASDSHGTFVRLPTGDGMALVFRDDMEAPVRCAVEIHHSLRDHRRLHLRIGIHSGPVGRVTDVNGQTNIAGAGINIAQRVMDCGDAGHILLSRRIAEDLSHHSKWRPHLHDLGECEVKHGVRVHLVNLCLGDVGNPALPEKLARAKEEQEALALAEDKTKAAVQSAAAARRRKKITLAAVAFVAMITLGLCTWWFFSRHSLGATRIASIAVRPLENLSGDASKNYFADGMTDELTTKMSQMGALKRVISRSAMMKYKESRKSSSEIARELSVDAVVEGSVMLSGDQARISVELIELGSDKALWAQSYTRAVANIVQLQDEVALAIADAIALKLTPGEKARLAGARVIDPQAYDYYLRGKSVSGTTLEGVDSRIELFEKAVARDGTFAEAYAELAGTYEDKGYFFDPTNKQWDAKADAAVAKALQLNPELPAALLAQAALIWRPSNRFPHEKSIAMLRHALAVAPNFGDAHFVLGSTYFHVGLLDEALQEFKRADELDPGNVGTKFHFGLVALLEGRYREAVPILEANLDGMPRPFAESLLASALFHSGRADEARARIDQAKAQTRDEGGILTATQALFLAIAGDKAGAKQKIEEAVKIGQGFGHFHHTTYVIASAYALMDEPAEAMKWLEYTAENGYPNRTLFERDPDLDRLRKDPRFIQFLDKLRPRFERLKAAAASPDFPRA